MYTELLYAKIFYNKMGILKHFVCKRVFEWVQDAATLVIFCFVLFSWDKRGVG